MKNPNNFAVEISSNLDFEEMVADILYQEETVATISQENGIANINIEIFPPFEAESWSFPFQGFISALQLAQKRLIEMQKFPDDKI